MKLLITGSTGYIGQRLVRAAQLKGYEVFTAPRSLLDLQAPQPVTLPENLDVVFHLAAITTSARSNPVSEIKAASYLFHAAAQAGCRIVFVSSQSSRADALTEYGRTKWQIEQLTLKANGCVIRPGQVYGGFESGLFGVLATVVRKLPCFPAFLPSPGIQPVHVDDLVAALLSAATTPGLEAAILNIGAEQPVSFTAFLKSISRHWVRGVRIPAPVPVLLIRAAIATAGAKLGAKLGLERLNSLFDLKAMETHDDLKRLGIRLRPLSSGMCRSGQARRRDLAAEGRALMSYLLQRQAAPGLIRRYIRSVELLRDGQALGISAPFLRMPFTLALLDTTKTVPTDSDTEFAWRLNTSMVLAEASPLGAQQFLGLGKRSGMLSNAIGITRTLALEVFWRIAQIICRPLVKAPFHRTPATSEKTPTMRSRHDS